MTWYSIWDKKPKYNQRVIIALRTGFMRVMDYKAKIENPDSSYSYKFTKADHPELYYCYSGKDFRWAEIDSEPKFD